MKNYEIFTGEELVIADRIQRLRYQLLIHSCIYYNLHSNLVEDYQWDAWAKELVELQRDHQEISKQVMLYEYFEDFDGSTGFDLPIDEDWVMRLAEKLLYRSGRSTIPISVKPVNTTKKIQKLGKRRLF